MKIIGIDPGTASTGFSIIEIKKNKLQLLDYGCIKTEANIPLNLRLKEIADNLNELIKKWAPARASIEKLFFKKNIKTAMKVSEARGVITEKLTEKGIEIKEFTPLEIKTAVCGYGRADKKMVQQMIKMILGLPQEIREDNAADAIAAAICLANGIPLEEKIFNHN